MKRFFKIISSLALALIMCLGTFGLVGCGADIRTANLTLQLYDYANSEFYDEDDVAFSVDLYAHLAPKTVEAMEKYINEGYYDNAIFYQIEGYKQIMFGDLKINGDKLEIEENGAKVNVELNSIKPKLPGEYEYGGTVGSDLVNKKGSVGLWRGWYDAGTDWMSSSASDTGRATWFMPTESLSSYNSYFCVFGQIDFEKETNTKAFSAISSIFAKDNYTTLVIYYTEKDGGYDASKDDYNLEFHCVTEEYFDSLEDDEVEALNIFEAEGRQLETFNKYEIRVANNSANGLAGAKIKSAKMA